jgi:hypothetical protein
MILPRLLGGLCAVVGLLGPGGAQAQAGTASDDVVVPIVEAIRQSNLIYLGWRVFQDKCARCHGADATGTDKAPGLLERVKPMSRTRFVATVLQRYKWVLPAQEAGHESGTPDALVQGIARREKGELSMPAWEKEPSVKAHIADIYDYLQARASGALGPGRPPWPGK